MLNGATCHRSARFDSSPPTNDPDALACTVFDDQAWMDGEYHACMTASPSSGNPGEVGGEFTAWNGFISGSASSEMGCSGFGCVALADWAQFGR